LLYHQTKRRRLATTQSFLIATNSPDSDNTIGIATEQGASISTPVQACAVDLQNTEQNDVNWDCFLVARKNTCTIIFLIVAYRYKELNVSPIIAFMISCQF